MYHNRGVGHTTRRAAFTPSFLKSSKISINEGAAYRRDATQRYEKNLNYQINIPIYIVMTTLFAIAIAENG